MSIDLNKLETEIDQINQTLASVYKTSERIYNKVKKVILDLAQTKTDDPELIFTYPEVQQIGKELIHNTIYDYTTCLRRGTFNEVISRLSHAKLIQCPFFKVPKQRHRNLYTRLLGINHKEFLLLTAIDKELQAFDLNTLDGNNLELKEDEIVCRVIASAAIHGAMIFKGFHKELFKLKFRDIDLNNNFLSVRNIQSLADEDDRVSESAFFRYFIPPVTMVYLLLLMRFYKKDRRTLKTPIRSFGKDAINAVFRQLSRPGGTDSFELTFKEWIRQIAVRNGLDYEMDIERFRQVCVAYLATKYPIFLLSVQARKPLSDSLDMRSFAPLLNINYRNKKKRATLVEYANDDDKDYRELLKDDKDIVLAVRRIISVRGSIKVEARKEQKQEQEKKKKKKTRQDFADEIQAEIDIITNIKLQKLGKIPVVLENYKIYWKWVISFIETTKASGGSIDTYTGSIGKYFIPLLTEKKIPDMTLKELDAKIISFLTGYETGENASNIKKFISFIMDECGRMDLKPLYNKNYPVMGFSYPKPLLYFAEIDKVLDDVTNSCLRCAIILGFYGGMRAGEIERLTLSNLIYDGGYVICVRKSKTRNGVRNIPIHLLMPEKHLREIVHYWIGQKTQRSVDSPFLVSDGKKLNSKKLASNVAKLFKERLGIIIRFHHLRHSFANWFLMRWFAAIYGKEHFEQEAPFLRDVLFSEDYLERIRVLLFGYRELQKGQRNFSHVFAALARLIGHGSPNVTIGNYIHTIDYLAYLCFRKKYANYQVKITNKSLLRLVYASSEALPDNLKGIKNINIQDIIRLQKGRLGL